MAKQWVCIKHKGDGKHSGEEDPLLIRIPHPRTGLPVRYMIQDGAILETQKIDPADKRSWFIDDSVQRDGSLYLMTPIDPLFIAIPMLELARKKSSESPGVFLTLDHLFDNPDNPSVARLATLRGLDASLAHVCDIKGRILASRPTEIAQGMCVYRLNDEKVVTWLRLKTRADTFIAPVFTHAQVERLSVRFDSFAILRQLIQHVDTETLDERQKKGNAWWFGLAYARTVQMYVVKSV
ncbi:Ydr279p protein family-domain-containing protein [Jimgerdemannia flammicorona]|uniref:Ribonuclease H2 subunit B n=1 Tax=Jimgerdemannia flammicorona TaxID=994334 RepID=A0A433QT78_9FUNG|nr:Ydr279p protein family-domain-containing protein [Jimgerdemannia flammicorona]